ncbi:MAG: AEC family transporter [Oscillospiraceae bacterium]|nr:AEC family transporter [Oscillospiraceae bacterium]
MFIYMAVGFALYRAKLVTKDSSKALANLLIYAVLPCVILKSFCVERTPDNTRGLLISLIAAFLLLLMSIVISYGTFRKRPVDNIAVAFSNAGFMGLPLVTAVFGADYVFYAVGFVAFLNSLQATYGQAVLAGDKSYVSPKAIFKNPIVISTILGLAVFFTGIPVPSILYTAVNSLSLMNGPLAMVIIGVYMAQADMKSMFTDRNGYIASAVRLIVIPAISLILIKLSLALPYPEISKTLLIVASAPMGSNVAVYAQKLDMDYTYAVKIVCLSTILSLVTMPIVMMFI